MKREEGMKREGGREGGRGREGGGGVKREMRKGEEEVRVAFLHIAIHTYLRKDDHSGRWTDEMELACPVHDTPNSKRRQTSPTPPSLPPKFQFTCLLPLGAGESHPQPTPHSPQYQLEHSHSMAQVHTGNCTHQRQKQTLVRCHLHQFSWWSW